MILMIETTFQLCGSLRVILALAVMLSVSSTHVTFEECSHESVSEQIEMVMTRRSVRRCPNKTTTNHHLVPHDRDLAFARPLQNRFFTTPNERANLNGSGTHLII